MTASSAVIAAPSSSDIFSITQASGWAEFFNKYGFMGVGLFLFLLAVSFFLLGRDRVVTYILGCIGLLLLVLFAGINFWVINEPYIIAQLPPMVFVRVINLPDSDSVALSPAGADAPRPYSQRENHPSRRDQFNERFIIISRPAFDCMTLVITHNNQDTAFDIKPIEPADGDGRTEIVLTPKSDDKTIMLNLRRQRDKKWLGQGVDLLPLLPNGNGESAKGCGEYSFMRTSTFGGLAALLIPSARAEDLLQKFSVSLQSSDVFTRRSARRDLAALGAEALPIISVLLQQDNYRLRLGALEALGDLPSAVRRAAPDDIWSHRAELFANPDEALKNAAQRAYDLNDAPLVYCYQERDDRKPANQRFLALCQWTEADCAKVRGENPSTKQTACMSVSVRRSAQRLQSGGILGSWYGFAATPFDAPYPQLSP